MTLLPHEITELRAERDRYREALEQIAAADDEKTESEWEAAVQAGPRIAREALNAESPECHYGHCRLQPACPPGECIDLP